MSTNHKGHYAVIGPPGTGKTTFLARQATACVEAGESVLLCSMTKTAEREIASRKLPIEPERVGTLHSHAYRAIGRPKIVTSAALAAWNDENPAWTISGGLADARDYDYERRGSLDGDLLMSHLELHRHRQTTEEMGSRFHAFAETWRAWKEENNLIDFTDMIELALRDAPHAKCAPNVIMADEAQDLSRLEYALLSRWARWASALFIIGDPWQSLYTWRGADPKRFSPENFSEDHQKVLNRSYRVPEAVHAISMSWATRLSDWRPIEYAPRDHPGEVSRIRANYLNPEPVVNEAERLSEQGKSVMIMGSCAYMLRGLIARMRARRIPFANPWREKRGDWNPLAKKANALARADRILGYLKPCNSEAYIHSAECEACSNTRVLMGEPCWVCTSTDPLDKGKPWTLIDLLRWMDPIRVQGVQVRGAKKLAEAWVERHGKDAARVTVTPEDLAKLFLPPHCELLARQLGGNVSIPDAIAWYRSSLLKSRLDNLSYPLDLVLARGRRVLTDPPRVYVGTVHSFKGGEADHVFIFPDLSLQAYREMRTTEGRDSVIRTFYVALTRAREAVWLCDGVDGKAVDLAA